MKTKKEKPAPPPTKVVNNSRIQNVAMLTRLSMSIWRAARVDETVSREIAKSHNSERSMGNYKKFLIAPEALDPVNVPAAEAYSTHNTLTLPWSDNGVRILSSAGYLTYTQKMRACEEAFWKAVKHEFLPKYAEHKAKAKQALNGLYNEAEYPAPEAIIGKFGFRLKIEPMPNYEDWRVNLSDSEVDRLRQEGKDALQQQLQESTQDIWRRFSEVVSRMVDRLNSYTVGKDGKVQNSFRDSLVTNVADLLEIVPVINVMNDPNIDQFAARIKAELTSFNPDVLRTNERVRKDVAKRAEEIMSKMSSFLS